MKKLFLLAVVSAVLSMVSTSSQAGTLIFKDGTKVSNIKIISIQKGRIVIEKDKKKEAISWKKIESYFATDLKDVGTTSVPGDYAEYSFTLYEVKMPKSGVDRKGKPRVCEIKYSVQRTGGKGTKIKTPYVYLYVLAGGKGSGEREIFRYFFPKSAKPKGKGYDQAAIMGILSKQDRPIYHFNRGDGASLGQKIEKIVLKGVKKRKILAYHLEAWGDGKIIKHKTEKIAVGTKIAKRWWEKF